MEKAFSFSVRVATDDRTPVRDAEVSAHGAAPVRTDASGELLLTLRGREGERRELVVHCPQEYQSPEKAVAVALYTVADAAKRPRYDVTCPRLKRAVIVAVRARNGADLPVLYLGQEIARTDASGAAHALLRLSPGEPFRLTIDTSEREMLRPESPSLPFVSGEKDDIALFEQEFTSVEKKRPVRRVDNRPRRL